MPTSEIALASRHAVPTIVVLVCIAAAVLGGAAALSRSDGAMSPPPAAAASPRSETPAAPAETERSDPPPTPEPEEPPSATTPPAPPTDAAGQPDGPIVLAFTGDVHGERQIGAALAAGGHPLGDIAPILADADLTVANLETAVGTAGSAAPKTYTFQAPPSLLAELVRAGVDVVSLANNHSLDYGQAGLLETLELVRGAGLEAVGAGTDEAAAYAPFVHEVRGRTIAIVGLTRVWPEPGWAATAARPGLAGAYDVHRAVTAVVEARARADVVVVVIHWGTEGADCPDRHQRELADALVAAGATAVVGHHPHVLQPVEERDGRLVAYSLGNFLWYTAGSASRLTGVLRLEIDAEGVAGWSVSPAVISPHDGGPRPATGADADAVSARLSRACPTAR